MKAISIDAPYSLTQRAAAWLVHALTASMALVGLYTLYEIYQHDYIAALWWMGLAIFIDAIDGTFARAVHIKRVVPKIDGALLDNIVDYLNYVITPCFLFLLNKPMLPDSLRLLTVGLIAMASSYQFTQADAKTDDHFFKGFPSYWNIVAFYLILLNTSPVVNAFVLLSCVVLVFVPIKYVYPSRMDYLTSLAWLRRLMLIASIVYGIVSIVLLWTFPHKHPLLLAYSVAYIFVYMGFSIYRTFVPLRVEDLSS